MRDAWNNLLRDTIRSHFFRQGLQMSFWRVLSLGFAAAGTIWAARCLGPEKFGISGMVISTIAQMALLVHLNQGAALVRLYKKQATVEEKRELISLIFTFRMTATILIILLAIPLVLALRLPPPWHLALLAGAPYFLFSVNIADWVLTAEGKMAESYKALTLQSVTTAVLYFLLFRPGTPAGSDVLVQAFAFLLSFIANWYYATGGRRIRLYQWHLLPKILPILSEGKWLVIMGFVLYVYAALESPLLGYLYSVKEMGIYRSATTLVAGFQALLVMLSALLYPRFIDWGKVSALYLWERQTKIALALVALFTPLALFTFLLAPIFFHYAYSTTYERAAYPFALLLTSRFTSVISSIFIMGLFSHHQDKTVLTLMSITSLISLILNLLLIPHYGVLAAASVNLASESLIMTGSFVLCRGYVKQQPTV